MMCPLYLLKKLPQKLLIASIKLYRYCFSLLLGPNCRFHPTCSSYAIHAIKIHGCFKGCYYALRRVLRCHPWHAGGEDPVP